MAAAARATRGYTALSRLQPRHGGAAHRLGLLRRESQNIAGRRGPAGDNEAGPGGRHTSPPSHAAATPSSSPTAQIALGGTDRDRDR
eukprot:7436247-Alexandrium_andersonii.AAC.1